MFRVLGIYNFVLLLGSSKCCSSLNKLLRCCWHPSFCQYRTSSSSLPSSSIDDVVFATLTRSMKLGPRVQCKIGLYKVHIFWEGRNIWQLSILVLMLLNSTVKTSGWFFFKFLWPYQNIWTLTKEKVGGKDNHQDFFIERRSIKFI